MKTEEFPKERRIIIEEIPEIEWNYIKGVLDQLVIRNAITEIRMEQDKRHMEKYFKNKEDQKKYSRI